MTGEESYCCGGVEGKGSKLRRFVFESFGSAQCNQVSAMHLEISRGFEIKFSPGRRMIALPWRRIQWKVLGDAVKMFP